MKSNKQTAVEWLHELFKQRELDKFDWKQAKEMEKEQIKDSHKHGFSEGIVFGASPIGYKYMTSEQYYEQTYGGN
jgi:uncharacterized glyoxalase superfamily protein PhnB